MEYFREDRVILVAAAFDLERYNIPSGRQGSLRSEIYFNLGADKFVPALAVFRSNAFSCHDLEESSSRQFPSFSLSTDSFKLCLTFDKDKLDLKLVLSSKA